MSAELEVSQEKIYLDDETVEKMVNNLKYLFNIESGNNLTFVLGYGHCRSNDEALKQWVIDHANPVNGLNRMFACLVASLQARLNIV